MNPESLQAIALSVTRERSLDRILKGIVEGLCGEPHVALARVWLLGEGDICPSCPMRRECPDHSTCLHLAASAGTPIFHEGAAEDWSRLDGDFRRFPMGVRKVGHIGATGSSILVERIERDGGWMARPEWLRREGITSFAGHPLVFRDEVLGVLAVFSRSTIDAGRFAWLRTFADHAAVAIANARALAEIERLRERLELENDSLREEVKATSGAGGIIGASAALRKVLEQIELVAPSQASVLILGESGTGKELVARRIHDRSPRRQRPFIKVNCASIPADLFESEFFGHAKGAFTGATRDRAGRFQAADGGTLLLDEVAEIPTGLQGKLLRALQEGQFERVGEDVTRRVDVRVIAATNRDLRREVAAGRFREDLFYRLSVFPIDVPPLRERPDDLPALAEHFVKSAGGRLRKPVPRLTQRDLALLRAHDWPGNVRELGNVIERAVILSRGGGLRLDLALPAPGEGAARATAREAGAVSEIVTEAELRRRERENIEAALRRSGGRIYGSEGAAALLGIKPTTLASRIKALGIRRGA